MHAAGREAGVVNQRAWEWNGVRHAISGP
jgi:hypothetical protein